MFSQIDQNLLKNPQENKSWYRDAENGCDLFLWKDKHNQIIQFQLWHEEFLVEWHLKGGLKTGQLDSKEGSFQNIQAASYHYHRTYLGEPVQKILQFIDPEHDEDMKSVFHFIRQMLNNA